jgi:hypothetical protein
MRSEAHVLFCIRLLRLCQCYLTSGIGIHNHLELFIHKSNSHTLGCNTKNSFNFNLINLNFKLISN